jgi:hypothetical protein
MEGGERVKKAIGIALVLLLACSVMASATETNWILTVRASDTAGGHAGATTNIGTQTGYTDAKDTTKGEPGTAPAPPIGGTLAYAESLFPDNAIGQLDFRAPIVGGETKMWTIKLFDQRTQDAQGGWPALVDPVMVKVTQSTTAGQSLVYSFGGVPYQYVVTSPGGIASMWVFDAEHQWSTTNYVQFTLTGVPEAPDALTMTILAQPVPEPGSLLALGTGLVGLVGFAIRRRRS